MPDPGLNGGQRSLFCRCGAALGCRARACRRCRQQALDSRRRFGGWRDAVLARDRGCCTGCGDRPLHPHVHHRRPGVHRPHWLVTVCPRCHARIHKLAALSRPLPARLAGLWLEQHPGAPFQLPLFPEVA